MSFQGKTAELAPAVPDNVRPISGRWPIDDNARLVTQIARGNSAAATQLYRRYSARIKRICVRMVGVDPVVGELVNDTFFAACKNIGSLNDSARLEPWLTKIAVRLTLQHLRKQKRRKTRFLLSSTAVDSIPDEQTTQKKNLMYDAVQKVLFAMSPQGRVIFSLRYFEQMEVTHIADALGVSLSTAKRRLKKSEAQFKKIGMGDAILAQQLLSSHKWRNR